MILTHKLLSGLKTKQSKNHKWNKTHKPPLTSSVKFPTKIVSPKQISVWVPGGAELAMTVYPIQCWLTWLQTNFQLFSVHYQSILFIAVDVTQLKIRKARLYCTSVHISLKISNILGVWLIFFFLKQWEKYGEVLKKQEKQQWIVS